MSDISAAEQMAINEALTDKTDIVWRLRANWSYLGREAADEITRLRAEVVALKEELSDVAAYAKACQSLLPATAASKMKETP